MKYRKKPVVIEAVQFLDNIEEIEKFVGQKLSRTDSETDELIIPTLEGKHIASRGDFIIKGVKGEFYPCKPDIFEMTYEAFTTLNDICDNHGWGKPLPGTGIMDCNDKRESY